ncbi:MAG: phytanoyl-CoA dioxygenase family protein [Bauldia litoralis]
MPKALSAQAVEHYRRDGYYFPHPVLDAGEVADLRARLEAVEAAQGGRLQPSQRNKSHLLFKWVDDLIRDPRILDPVEDLIGPNILCWNTLFWIKEAGSPSFVSWHQDARYWGLTEDTLVTVWLALSDASVEAGCMRVLPGSHRREECMAHADRYDAANMLTRGQAISEGIDESAAVFMPLKPGEASFHNIKTAHGSGANTGADRRIGLSMHFIPPSVAQTESDWDCAALVRGEDPSGHFVHTPRVERDLDPDLLAFHEKATGTVREILYRDAAHATGKL